MMHQEAIPNEYKEIDLIDFIKIILKRKKIVLLTFLTLIIFALGFSFLTPKVYKIDTVLEIGIIETTTTTTTTTTLREQLIESPKQLVEKIKNDTYGIYVREKLNISKKKYPEIKVDNLKDTNLILIEINSSNTQQAKNILEEINNLILTEHLRTINSQKAFIENNIEYIKKNIENIKIKIKSLENEKNVLEKKIDMLEKNSLLQTELNTYFMISEMKEKLEQKKREIFDLYSEINSLENQISILSFQIENIKQTSIIKKPTISEIPVRPRIFVNLGVACFLGLFFGIFLAIFKEYWSKESANS